MPAEADVGLAHDLACLLRFERSIKSVIRLDLDRLILAPAATTFRDTAFFYTAIRELLNRSVTVLPYRARTDKLMILVAGCSFGEMPDTCARLHEKVQRGWNGWSVLREVVVSHDYIAIFSRDCEHEGFNGSLLMGDLKHAR